MIQEGEQNPRKERDPMRGAGPKGGNRIFEGSKEPTRENDPRKGAGSKEGA